MPEVFAFCTRAWKEILLWNGAPWDPPAPGVNAVPTGPRKGVEVWTMTVLYPLASMTTYEGTARKDVEGIMVTLATQSNCAPEHCIKTTDLVPLRKHTGIWSQELKGPKTTTLFLSG